MSKSPLNTENIAYGGTGLVALIFFISTLFLLLYGFSAYIIRSQIDVSTAGDTDGNQVNVTNGNATTNLDKLIHTIEKYNKVEADIAETQRNIYNLEHSIRLTGSQIQTTRLDLTKLNISTGDIISGYIVDLHDLFEDMEFPFEGSSINTILQDKYIEENGRLPFKETRFHLNVYSLRLKNYSDRSPHFEEASQIITDAFKNLNSYEDRNFNLQNEINLKTFESGRNELDLRNERYLLERLQASQNEIAKNLPKDSEFIFTSLNLLGGTLLFFVKLPTIVLTLIVTIAAGGLASLVSFTRKFLHKNRRQVGVGTLLSNVAEGIAASIGIFLFAGTGMLMLTQGGANAPTNVELSPYMVAFLAFLSGFMAESAFRRIEDAGKNFFKTKKDQEEEKDQENKGNDREPSVQI